MIEISGRGRTFAPLSQAQLQKTKAGMLTASRAEETELLSGVKQMGEPDGRSASQTSR